ncbi:MAG: acyl-CoA dehydrogenase [Devosia sp.]|uniref:acyl-CoA dehydrogenase n=1 Tax=Devosia sp. XGJD_8 TaxID=3391187 RepID=UPI001D8F52C4|nr:acyl-CoA dehydrogenase [Alphaproteobacteria bacterium]MBU1560415.1 acyl-CoA dehydrogenase [Alphaproteobacteria bacterium]MBU2303740.1 acyl-CoA dehydrogenase [Alphaproteobacteria bacterium]MBU2366339.1 acyl-CoA dehydrogenase [Alphaproteobacteria bacterium]
MTFALIAISLIVFAVLAMRESPLWQWGVAVVVIGLLAGLDFPDSGISYGLGAGSWVLLVIGALLLVLSVEAIRKPVLIKPIYGAVKSILPRVSRTEQEALDAGTVGWDAELFSGRPNWDKLTAIRPLTLTAEEQAFIDGPTNVVCSMIDDWDTRNNRADLSPEVWQFLKDNGFLGMLIAKEHGGLGFGAQAQSMIVSKISSRSVAAGITVMVPNSLGPGELLEKYGTHEQKEKYLGRLAKGLEVPCFALTGVHSGSDAGGMRDIGVVTKGTYQGKEMLGVKLSFDKRYITLAPIATLVGLAFILKDPDNLLGRGTEIGITLALVPHDHPGVEIGRRHFPARQAFMNGPVRGTDVFIPMDFLIGGTDYAGQGWRMLMECLSTGRAISLPAIGTTSIKQALRVTSAYARVRRQFGIPVGIMEGVAEPLGEMVKRAYTYEASRRLTASMVDEGQRPAVISALLKYRTTEAMRDSVDDSFDIHGGRAIQDGPGNYLFGGYMATPVAITVEGANILTRTLMTFAQGVLRAHPFLYKEIEAVQNKDKKAGLDQFDRAFGGHTKFMLRNIAASFLHGISNGAFASTPNQGPMAHWYRRLHRYSQAFALTADWTTVFLGGALKRKQKISGRMADILGELYLMSATLRRFEDEGRIAEDRELVEAIMADRVAAMEKSFGEIFANFPNPAFAWAMRVLCFPLGRHAKPASDRVNYRFVRAVLRPGAFRDRLTTGTYVSMDPNDVTGVLEDALIKVTEAEEIEAKFVKAARKGVIERRLDRDAIDDAVAAGVLSGNEAGIMRAADEATDRVVKVDDFAPDELAAEGKDRVAAE